MEISSRYIKLQAQFEIPEDLKIGRDYEIALSGSITACTESDDEKGGIERKYSYKSILGQITRVGEPTVKLTDKTRKSVKLRSMIMTGWGENYDSVMNVLLANGDELRAFYEKYKV